MRHFGFYIMHQAFSERLHERQLFCRRHFERLLTSEGYRVMSYRWKSLIHSDHHQDDDAIYRFRHLHPTTCGNSFQCLWLLAITLLNSCSYSKQDVGRTLSTETKEVTVRKCIGERPSHVTTSGLRTWILHTYGSGSQQPSGYFRSTIFFFEKSVKNFTISASSSFQNCFLWSSVVLAVVNYISLSPLRLLPAFAWSPQNDNLGIWI